MTNKIFTIRWFLLLFAYCIEPVVRIVPRNKKKWAFGATMCFKDNPKYLFYWTVEQHKDIRAIWIAKNHEDVKFLRSQGYEAYYELSFKGLYHALTAKVYIGDHHVGNINPLLSGGAYFVNLWHGASVKRVRWQAAEHYMREYHLKNASEMKTSFTFKISEYLKLFRKPDLLLTPSVIQAHEFFSPMLEVPIENCIVGVYPRSRLLLSERTKVVNFIEKYEPHETLSFVNKLMSYDKVYIYMPTWRADDNNFIEQAKVNWRELDNILKARNEILIVRFHPITRINLDDFNQFDNIVLYPAQKTDIYTVLPFVDCLITDYSSVYTDFLIMNKEIILFVFDYDTFVKNSHDLNKFDEYYLGQRAYNFNELLELIKTGKDCHIPKGQYQRLMRFFWDCNEHQIDIADKIKKRIGIRQYARN